MDEQDRRNRGHMTFSAVGRRCIGRDTCSPEQSAETGKNPIDIQVILRFQVFIRAQRLLYGGQGLRKLLFETIEFFVKADADTDAAVETWRHWFAHEDVAVDQGVENREGI